MKYEAMFIVKPDLAEEAKKSLFAQIQDTVSKNNGSVTQGAVWQEKKKLYFPLKKYYEGAYYLMNFNAEPLKLSEIRHAYKLNENILRVLITKAGGKE